jgi:hypothetical protein
VMLLLVALSLLLSRDTSILVATSIHFRPS